MSSHLSVSFTSGTGTPVTKALNAAQDTGDDTLKGIAGLFASLIGGGKTDTPTSDTTETSQTSQVSTEINLAGLIGLALHAGTDKAADDATDPTDDDTATDTTVDPSTIVVPQAIAALPTVAQQPAADLVQSLTELSAALAKGEAPSPDLLDKLNQQLDALGQALGVPAATTPSFADALAQATATLPEDASIDTKFDQKLAALAVSLATPAPAAAGEIENTTVSQQAQDIAAKLATMAKSLGDGTIPAETLSKLGLKADAAGTEPALQKAIASLVGSAPAANASASATFAASAAAPALANPTLKLSETSLTGKAEASATAGITTTETSATADNGTTKLSPTPSAAPVVTPSTGDTASIAAKDKDGKKSDVAGIAAAVTGTADATTDNTTTGNAAQVGVQTATKIEAPAAAKAAPTVYQTSQQQINVPQIAFEMVRQVQHGNSKFQIRLDPPELGRIDVQMTVDKTGTVNARMMVEKAETLDLMQRDQRSLQQALQQAGIDSSKTNLEFSLRQNSSGQQQQGQSGDRFPAFGDTAKADDIPAPAINLYRGNLSASGVNILA